MAIVDADCHISPVRARANIGYEELLRRMDAAGVARALVWLTPLYTRQVAASNAYVHEAARSHPDRLLGFGWADPHLGVQEAKDEAARCIQQYGFPGVKLNGAQNDFFVDDPEISLPLVDEVVRLGGSLAFHCGADAYDKTHPHRIATIAKRHPATPILCVHMGGVRVPDLSREAVELAREHANVTLIGSHVAAGAVLRAVQTLGADRVCFGSDTPFELMHVALAMYRALLAGQVSQQDQAKVMGGNILRVLGAST